MKSTLFSVCAALATLSTASAALVKRDGFESGEPYDPETGKGGPILGGTNTQIDLQNPDNLGQQSTDNGIVPNLKWSFSDSKTRILKGGWVREQVITDLPASHDIAAAQQHLTKGSIRELHWHRVAEWGFVYNGSIIVSAVNADGEYEVDRLGVGDIWYFPKGVAHTVQGIEEHNEFLLVFDDGNFDALGTTFNIDDWLAHTPKDVIAKNFGLNESVFEDIPSPPPYILNATLGDGEVTGGTPISGNNTYTYHTFDHPSVPVPGQGGVFYKIDSTVFPIATTIAATYVRLEPRGLRELHWHPNAEEWLYFHHGKGRATVFIGSGNARTFDFSSGDTAVFPDNSGHYIENLSDTEDLIWIEIYKSDVVQDISLTQWLALTPPEIVSAVLKIPVSVVEGLKKEKQILIKGS